MAGHLWAEKAWSGGTTRCRAGYTELLLLPPAALSTSTITLLAGAAHPQQRQASPRMPQDLDLPASTSLPQPLPVSLYQKRNYRATCQAPQLEKAPGWGEEAARPPAQGCWGTTAFLMPLISIPP